MPKPNRLPEIEQEQGEALETLIPRLLNELQTQSAVANALGTTPHTILRWCKANKIERQIVWHQLEKTS